MLDPANDLLPQPSSPTISSLSSSDLDTESTGSFFHDRSTTLGTLMGVTFPAIAFRPVVSQRREEGNAASSAGGEAPPASGGGGRRRPALVAVAERRRRRWWRLCRDDQSRRSSLAEFLEVERRFGDAAFFGATAELQGVVDQPRNGRLLFADGRVLPPPQVEETPPSTASGTLCRFPVSLTGICSGGVG
ncbi:uncharacterized protein At3g17950 [Diospyros lotus]|uniref:uncharacterized protein At3g17950 n=1 Tax=Diospyros lotus TaxID=55363 RepID=UPI00224EBDC5|nr:uncharacterized protein At3g17950 [Diospyros lotus]